jgi:predicted metalloprotease with PDZ domain
MKRAPGIVGGFARLASFILILAHSAPLVVASAAEPQVAYNVALRSLEQHLVEVEIRLAPGPAERDLVLPVWNALYQVRDFAQFVNWIQAKDPAGHALAIREEDKSRWHLAGAAQGATVEYQVFADASGPFGAQLNTHHAFFNLAEILMYPLDGRNSPVTLHFSQLPSGWRVAAPLSEDFDLRAENYDRLVDSPVEIGTFHEADFAEAGARFRVIIDADPADYDPARIVADLHKIVAAAISWMNDRPFDSYMFLYHFPHGPAGGGMEHAYSTAIELNADSIRQSLYPLTAVTAHEFFHLWNVKRIRPQTLEPIDYTRENYTRALWFSEGVTSTVEEIIQLRAGLMSEEQFLGHLADEIGELEHRPAHLTQSAEDSSLDAWLEAYSYYRRPERSVSYYNKGELLGTMLDLALRDASRGQASLRELFEWLNENYAKQGRYFDDSRGLREAAEAVARTNFSGFFQKYVEGTDEIPWNDFLRSVGLRVETRTVSVPEPGFLASRSFDSPMVVEWVSPGGEAEKAGLQVGDTITQLEGKAVGQESREDLSRLHAGDTIVARVRHHGAEHELKWKMAAREDTSYQVKDLDPLAAEQRARRTAWLKGEAQSVAGADAGPGAAPLAREVQR